MISAADLGLLQLTDDPDEAVSMVVARYAEREASQDQTDDGSTKYGPGGVLPGP
jgi:hypothetical protein